MNSAEPSGALVRRDLLLLLGLALLILSAGIGLRNPWPADEPLFATMARDMYLGGRWLIPTIGADFWQDKPPLFLWLVAISYAVTGSLKVGFLLPSMLAGLGTLALIYDIGRRLWSREAGFWAAALLLFCVQFTVQSRQARMDATLMFFTILSLYCLLRQLLLDGGWRWGIAAGVAAGAGVLSKVVGFFSFFVLLPWLYAWWRGWPGIRWQRPWILWSVVGLACAGVVALWLVPMLIAAASDPAVAQYRDELLFEQTVGRYANPWHHRQPAWYYLYVILTVWVPLVLLLPWLAPRWLAALRAREARVLLPLAFTCIYVLFFTLSSGKRDVYILSALPPLALAAGYLVPELLRLKGVQRALLSLAWLIAGGAMLGFVYLQFIDPAEGKDLLRKGGVANLLPLLAIGLAGSVAILWARLHRAHLALAGVMTSTWLVLGYWIFPQMDGERSAARFIARVEQMAAPDRPLGVVDYREHFLWNFTRPTVNFGNRRSLREGEAERFDAAAWLAEDPRRQLLLRKDMMQPCFAGVEVAREVGFVSREDWFLISGTPDPVCVARGNARRALNYDPRAP